MIKKWLNNIKEDNSSEFKKFSIELFENVLNGISNNLIKLLSIHIFQCFYYCINWRYVTLKKLEFQKITIHKNDNIIYMLLFLNYLNLGFKKK